MSYNSDLQSNNADLQKILDRVNALPDIDSSGGVFLPDLGDTAAQPTDIAAGKVLYDDEGNPVTGNVSVYDTQVGWDVDPQEVGGKINLSYYTTKPYLFRAGVVMESELEKFGDAMPEQVAKGVKFTSKAGLLKSGEMEPGITPSGSLDITNNGTYNVTNYASAIVNVPSSGGSSGVTLPDLENEGDEYSLLEGTQLIAQDGTVVDGRISRNTTDDITVDGAMVKVAPGYYENTSIRTVSTTSQATPSISLDEETGLITVTSNQSEGYVSSGTKTKTMSLDVLGRNEIMPGVADQTIDPGVYITGEQIIKGDSNLTAANIVKGVSIFGIDGAASVDVSDLTNVGNLHYWEKHEGNPSLEYVQKEVTNVSLLVYSKVGVSSTSKSIYYGDTFSYDPETGRFTLNSAGSCNTGTDAQEHFPGKFIKYSFEDTYLYFIPDTAVISEYTSTMVGTGRYIRISNATKYSANKLLNYVASDTDTTYPSNGEHSDGYWYIYGGLLSDAIEDESDIPDSPEISEVEQATPSISIDNNGLIIASATQEEGYVAEGTKTSEMQLNTRDTEVIIPSTTDQKIGSGVYLTGEQTIKGDKNLTADNIRDGVTIFETTGTYKASIDSVVPMSLGGTGATDGSTGLRNLMHSGPIILKEGVDYHYGSTLPPAGTPGRLFFLRVSDS